MISSFLQITIITVFFFIHVVRAQQNSSDNSSQDQPVGNFQPSLAVVIGMLSIMFSLTFVLLLYAKFCHRASSVHSLSHQIQDSLIRSRSRASGLDKTVVESLPFFRFSSLRGSRDGLECAVCLAKFEDVEVLRLLPKCKHAFHIDCIDRWLEKHSTCPLCRHKVSPEDLSQLPYSTSLRFLWNHNEPGQESNLGLYVQREESRHGSSRFSIGSSFRKVPNNLENDEECMPIPQSMDSDQPKNPLHKFNHKILVSDVVLKNRWSNVSSSDLMFLNSEMLNYVSSARFSSVDYRNVEATKEITENNDHVMDIKEEMDRKRAFESKLKEIRKTTDQRSVTFPGVQTAATSDSGKVESKALNQSDKRSMSEIIVHPRFIETRNQNPSLSERNVKEERTRRIWLPIARKTVQWFANREKTRPQRSNV